MSERQKAPMLVITFETTTAAMHMDAVCTPAEGRLIPIPRELSGGCGLAFCAEPCMQQALTERMAQHGVAHQQIATVMLYV